MSEEHFHVDPALKLPVVDLAGLAEAADAADAAALAPLAAAFDHACRDHGFCYIAGHGVASEANLLHVLRWHLARIDAASQP